MSVYHVSVHANTYLLIISLNNVLCQVLGYAQNSVRLSLQASSLWQSISQCYSTKIYLKTGSTVMAMTSHGSHEERAVFLQRNTHGFWY